MNQNTISFQQQQQPSQPQQNLPPVPPPQQTPEITQPSQDSLNIRTQHSLEYPFTSKNQYGNQIPHRFPAQRAQSDKISIQKSTPIIERPKDGGALLIKKGDQQITIEKKPQPQKSQQDNPSISIQKPFSIQKPKRDKNPIIFTRPKLSFSELLSEWKKLDENENFSPFQIRSKGYIILKNYVFETDRGPQSSPVRSSRGRQNQGRGKRPQFAHSPSVATLVELNSNRFISTQLEKNIGEWDDTSDEAFKININQILNRLTPKNMDQSLTEIKDQISIVSKSAPKQGKKNMSSKEREQFVAKTLVDKATKEQSFSDLYAQFTAKCSPDFIEKIIELNHSTINDSIVNPGSESDELSSLMCNGSAKFFASLACMNLVPDESFFDIVISLLNELKDKENPHSYHIEMLNSFYLNITPEVSEKIDDNLYDEFWNVIDDLMHMATLKKRLYFLLLDITEKHDNMREHQDGSQNNNKASANEQFSKENMSKVRGAFSSYLESYTLPDIDLKSSSFFYAAMDIFPDQSKYYFDFCQFICSVLKSMHSQKNDNARVLLDRVQKFRDQNIEDECPNIWANISTLINMLLLEDLLILDKANDIHKKFPEPVWDFCNSMKWYLYDFHDFREAIHVDSRWPLELYDALKMPEKIDNINMNNFPMSRLICVALIRTLYQKFKDFDTINLHTFAKWKPELALAARRHPDTFRSEIEILLTDFEMKKTVDQFIEYCNKET